MALKDLLARFKKGLAKTAQLFNVRSWFGRKVDQDFLDMLEAKLIQADVGVKATDQVVGRVREAFADQTAGDDLLAFVKDEFKSLLADPRPGTLAVAPAKPTVYLIAGVNGAGKTTSIAKLAQRLKNEGRSILLAALATPSAPAAADQLYDLGRAIGLRHRQGGPRRRPGERRPRCVRPGAGPWRRRPDRRHRGAAPYPGPPDARAGEGPRRRRPEDPRGAARGAARPGYATNGQNAIRQAEVFTKSIGCTGVVLTKLDGTAKGGVVVAIRQALDLPVKFIGVGEGIDDLQPFDAELFVESLFS